ncbi:MAG: dUTP diphosphatase [Alicyclobacillus sp.]|nr:dUTP diphosphatase [Alicyclobacillus sp.]
MPDLERASEPGCIEVRYRVVSPLFQPSNLPRYATEGAAGMDLHACIPEPWELGPGCRVRVPTGIALEFPHRGVVGLVYARSGLAWRHGIGLPNGVGVIDSDYTGEIQVLLTNFSDAPYIIEPGARIAQLVFAPVFVARLLETDHIAPTARGARGFGSTGV